MKGPINLITLFFTFLFVFPVEAQKPMKFDPDSVPSNITSLRAEIYNPVEFIPLWYQTKRDIEAKGGDNVIDLYYLYKERVLHHFENAELDSLKKYTPVFKDLCLKVGDEYQYYRCWDLLCDLLLFSNLEDEAIAEHRKMHEDASAKKVR